MSSFRPGAAVGRGPSSFGHSDDGIPAEIVNTRNIHFRFMKESFRDRNRRNCFDKITLLIT